MNIGTFNNIGYYRGTTTNVVPLIKKCEPTFKIVQIQTPVKFKKLQVKPITNFPLTFEERMKLAKQKLAKMSDEEKWKLIEESYGMWENYPEDWLKKMREGTLPVIHSMRSDIRYVLLGRYDVIYRLLP